MEKLTFHIIGRISIFEHRISFLSTEIPFSECIFSFSEWRILGSLFRVPLQFGSTKFAFSERRILIFVHIKYAFFLSAEFPFSECGILKGVTSRQMQDPPSV